MRQFKKWALLIVSIAMFSALGFLVPLPAAHAGCLEDTRRVQLSQDHVRLRTFLCGPDDNPQSPPVLRVEFHRLSDAAASTLVSHRSFPLMGETLGAFRVLENDVYAMFRKLVQRFGQEREWGPNGEGARLTLSVETPKGGTGGSEEIRKSLIYSFGEGDSNPTLRRRIDANEHARGWRYATDADFRDYRAEGGIIDGMVGLEKFLFLQGCPRELFVVVPEQWACEPGKPSWRLSLLAVEPILDVAVVENISNKRLLIRGFWGTQATSNRCQKYIQTPEQTQIATRIMFNDPLVLEQGQSILIPLKIVISGQPPSQRQPTRSQYVFGPEWQVGGLDVDGQRVTLAKKSSNFLNLTLTSGAASCPYLLAWNPGTEAWTEYGKVLHVARSKDTEQAHTTPISGFRSKFRLAERELEVAYIDHAELTAELKDGRSLTLTASEPRLANRDDQYVVLRLGELVDFEFKLPDGVKESDVNESKLTVFGYYEPIASLVRK